MEARPYQEEAVAEALKYSGYCFFSEQRTGKTLPALKVVAARAPTRLLIVCPNIAIDVWEGEMRDYGLSVPEVKVLNFEAVWGQRRRLKKWKPDMVVIDEAHRIKNRKSKQSKAIRGIAHQRFKDGRLKWQCPYRLALTGTPTGQGLQDAWAIMDFIDPKLFGDWDDFSSRYLVKGGFWGKKIIGYQNQAEFTRRFNTRFHRVLLGEVSKQEVKEHIVKFSLAESRPHYDSMFTKFIVELKDKRKRIIAPLVITQIMKLHQLTSGFVIDADGIPHQIGEEKLTYAVALVLKLNEPVVIVARFIHEMQSLAKLLRALSKSVLLISADHPYKKGDFTTDVAILQIQSGVAIDLARAKKCIFYSVSHSYITFDQARFRIREYIENATAFADYYYLIANGTVDEDVYQAVRTKQNIASLVLDKYRRLTK